jgi:hypothetical protein
MRALLRQSKINPSGSRHDATDRSGPSQAKHFMSALSPCLEWQYWQIISFALSSAIFPAMSFSY